MPPADIEKKTIIRQSARELFFRLGFNKTSMGDIARQSGLAKPTLYYYYPSKESIFDEIVIEEATFFMEAVEQEIPDDSNAVEKVKHFFKISYHKLKQHADVVADLPRYLCEHSPHGHPIVEKLNTLYIKKLIPLLREGREEGLFDIEDEELTAVTLVYMTEFLNLDWIQHYPQEKQEKVVETMINLLLNGLKRRN